MQVFNRVTKEKVNNNNNILSNSEELNKLESSFRKKKSLFQDESEISDGYKPFRITLRKTNQARRSYLPNPNHK